jgi:hypothetical protein
MSSVYQNFIAANHALKACYEAVPLEQFQALSAADQKNLCHAEKAAVRDFLSKDQVHFRELIQARINSFQ